MKILRNYKLLGSLVVALLLVQCSGFLDIPVSGDVPFFAVTSSTGGFSVPENGTLDLSYNLNKHPQANVTFQISISNTADATIAETSLTFTPDDWYKKRTLVVSGVIDNQTDGNKNISLVFGPAVSDDAEYNGYTKPSQTITVIDVDSDSIVVSPTSGLQTTETGGTATFTVVLSSIPTDDVLISSVATDDVSEGSINKSNLTFTTANWNVPQVVTITGQQDSILDGDVNYNIVLSNSTSTDTDYNGLTVSNVAVTNSDDEVPAIVVTPTSLSLTEGETKTFTVVLNVQPTASVTVAVPNPSSTRLNINNASDNPITELTFTPANYNTAQTVKVVAINNATQDGNITGSIITTSTNYAGVNPSDVDITVFDDDSAGVIVSNLSNDLKEDGTTATFTVRLQSAPDANVVINFAEDNSPNENCNEGKIININGSNVSASACSTSGAITKSVTFTPANYSTPQTIQVQGIDDFVDDGNLQYIISLLAITTSDTTGYSGLDPGDVTVNNLNDDTSGFIIVANNKVDGSTSSTSTGKSSVTIAGFATDDSNNLSNSSYSKWTIQLRSQPTATVTVGLTINTTNDDALFVSNGLTTKSLTFTTANWNVAQDVVLKGNSDTTNEGNITFTVTTSITTVDTKYSSSSFVKSPSFSIYSCDNDGVNVVSSCYRSGGLATSEGGGTAQVWFIAQSDPGVLVTIPVSSNDETEGIVTTSGDGTASTGSPKEANALMDSSNWNLMTATSTNHIIVTGQDDGIFDANILYSLVVANPTTGGGTYTGFNPADVAIRNTDDEQAFNFQAASGDTSEGGSSTTFGIRLGLAPTASVTVSISCGNAECSSLDTSSLTFTTTNWNTYQTITVTGANDNQADGTQGITVTFGALDTTDEVLKDIIPPSATVANNLDNDKLIWITSNTYLGNFNATTDMGSVDNQCASTASDVNSPSGGFSPTPAGSISYQALVAHSSFRVATTNGSDATGQLNWALKPNTEYYLKTGSAPYTTKLFTTNSYGLVSFPLDNAFNSGSFWTGLNSNWTTATDNCSNWSDDDGFSGKIGANSDTSSGAISNSSVSCAIAAAIKKSLICVQQ